MFNQLTSYRTTTGRVGNLGLATAFFNLKNAPISKNLIELLRESGQEVPDFLYSAIEDLHEARDARRRGRGGARGGGRPRFGARDYRQHQEEHPDFSRQVHYTRRGSFEQRDPGESWRSGPQGGGGGKADGGSAPRTRHDGDGGRGQAGPQTRRAEAVPTDWWAANADERN